MSQCFDHTINELTCAFNTALENVIEIEIDAYNVARHIYHILPCAHSNDVLIKIICLLFGFSVVCGEEYLYIFALTSEYNYH